MNQFKVVLSSSEVSFVEADRYVEQGGKVRFYRHGRLISEFQKGTVLEITALQSLTDSDIMRNKAATPSGAVAGSQPAV